MLYKSNVYVSLGVGILDFFLRESNLITIIFLLFVYTNHILTKKERISMKFEKSQWIRMKIAFCLRSKKYLQPYEIILSTRNVVERRIHEWSPVVCFPSALQQFSQSVANSHKMVKLFFFLFKLWLVCTLFLYPLLLYYCHY